MGRGIFWLITTFDSFVTLYPYDPRGEEGGAFHNINELSDCFNIDSFSQRYLVSQRYTFTTYLSLIPKVFQKGTSFGVFSLRTRILPRSSQRYPVLLLGILSLNKLSLIHNGGTSFESIFTMDKDNSLSLTTISSFTKVYYH